MRRQRVPNHRENRPAPSFLDIAEWQSCGACKALDDLLVPNKVSIIQK